MKTESPRDEKQDVFISIKNVTSCFAKWAVQQSPYMVPDDLGLAIAKFHTRLEEAFREYIAINDEWICGEISRGEWSRKISSIILDEKFREVYQWNERKNGKQGHGFTSAYSSKKDPDDDFIDLHALAGNVTVETWNNAVTHEDKTNDSKAVEVKIPQEK